MQVKKPPRKGDRITLIVEGTAGPRGQRRVWKTIVAHRGLRRRGFTPQNGPLIVAFTLEGIIWARGWDTPDALALRATVALENCVEA